MNALRWIDWGWKILIFRFFWLPNCRVGDAIKNYQDTMVKTVKKGWPGNDGNKNEKQWSFSGGFLYSLTVITTIGEYTKTHSQPYKYITIHNKIMLFHTIWYFIFMMICMLWNEKLLVEEEIKRDHLIKSKFSVIIYITLPKHK